MITVRARIDDVGTTVRVDEQTGIVEADYGLDVELERFVARGEQVAGTVTGPFYAPTVSGDPVAVTLTVCHAVLEAGWEVVSVDPPLEPVGLPDGAVG